MNRLLTTVFQCVSAAAIIIVAPQGFAQNYPVKPIRIVVPYPAGGTTDILAREIGQKLGESMKQPVVVDNRPGANGNIGAQAVATAPPDGYTLLMSPAGTLTFASPGTGSSPHLSGELFKTMAGVNLQHVPYKGAAPAINDLLGGVVTMSFDTVPSSTPHVKGGKLRALAVTSAKRLPQFPEIPTVAESGVPGYESTTWFGLLAPAGTPKDIVDKLHAEVIKAMQTPDIKERFAKQGADPVGNTPEQFTGVLKSETAKWGKVIKDSGVRLE